MADDRCNEIVDVYDMRGNIVASVACGHVGKHLPSDKHSATFTGRRLIGTDVKVDFVWSQERKPRTRRK